MNPLGNPEQEKQIPNEGMLPGHKTHVAPLRTFSSDLATAIREKGGSVVRIAIAEEQKHRKEFEESSLKNKKNLAFTIFSILLILTAGGILVFSYAQKQQPAPAVPQSNTGPTTIIRADNSQLLDITGMQPSAFVAAVQGIIGQSALQPGQIANIVLTESVAGTKTQVSTARLFDSLNTHAPANFADGLKNDYMLGTYLYDQNNLFLIIHGTSHDFMQNNMLAWEPNLFLDLAPLFNIDTTKLTGADKQNIPFVDTIIQNRNARAVLDKTGKPELYYSFLDPNTIMIASDQRTLAEVVHRF